MIKASCKICGFEKEFLDKYTGKTFKCPSCTTLVKIEPIVSFEQSKTETELPIDNNKVILNKNSEIKPSSKTIYLLLLGFVVILLYYLIDNSYNQRTKETKEIVVIDAPLQSNTSEQVEYIELKKPEESKIIEEEIIVDKDLNAKQCGDFDISLYNQAKSKIEDGFSYNYYFKKAWEYVQYEGEKSYNAILYFEEAIKLNPDNGGAYSDLGNCYRGGFKCYKKAEASYSEAINRGFQRGFVFYNRAICRYENGDLEGMREDLQTAKENGWNSDSYNLSNK